MSLFELLAVLLTLTALFSYLNHRLLGLPTAIGVMAVALAFSLALVGLGLAGLDWAARARELVAQVRFDDTLLHGMLSFLLFAGALQVDLNRLLRHAGVVGTLATAGVLLSTLLVGLLLWALLPWLGLQLPLAWCLVFGALISPTDPVAVLGILKSAGAPPDLEDKITGESLFNDGVGVVLFAVLLEAARAGSGPGTDGAGDLAPGHVALLFLQEAGGGALLGLALGWLTYRALRSVDHYQVEVLLTLALVTGGYALAERLHVSGPLAMVVAGLLIGNHGRLFAMSARTREHLDTFWELTDEVLNAVLFLLIGLEVLVLAPALRGPVLLAGLAAVPVVLLARLVSVGLPVGLLRPFRAFGPGTVRVLTWGGLRGGISVALALSLPEGPARELLVPVTYVVVVFSILVQGLTLGWAVPRPGRAAEGG